MIVSLLICYGAFNWTSHPKPLDLDEVRLKEEIPIEIPITVQPKQEKVRPPVAFTPTEKIEIPDEPEFLDKDEPEVTETTDIPENAQATQPVSEVIPNKAPDPAPYVEPIIEDTEDEKPMLIVEIMPVFNDCSTGNATERKMCSDAALLKYISSQIKYPAMARENNLQGQVIVRFVIDKNGKVTTPEIMRDPGMGMGDEVLRILKNMPDWTPGRQNGRPVAVYFNLPVKFRLN